MRGMSRPLALIVDDEPDICELLQLTLARMQVDAHTAGDLHSARALLQLHRYDLCLTDMRLPDGDGLELVEYVQQRAPELPIAVITAYGSVESAVQALKAGAFDFVTKPVDLQSLRKLISATLKLGIGYPERDRRSRHTLLGDSPAMRQTRSTIAKLARSQAPVYVSGESGTGKELVARLIHEKGPRADKPFVPVNCGAIPADLMESEFFGHRKGAFTGAVADKEGLFQAADGGTLFLDEVADLPLHVQVKLLRAIQEKAVRPVGAQKEVPIDVRILSATHKDLGALVTEGSFRQDLYYRINVIELPVPALRERPEDVPVLAEHILTRLAKQSGIPLPRLESRALAALQAHAFPGNVRELENILERAMTLCEGSLIREEDLRLPQELTFTPELEPELGATGASLESYLDRIEKDTIQRALEQTRYNKTAAAKVLGITFRALRYRLKKLGME
jgi:two-component system, NtrC family, response regulator PilR